MRVIEVVDYRSTWKIDFEIEKQLLENVLSTCDAVVHHIGSTSIPGLAAKPVIDILLEVSSLELLDTLEAQMGEISYVSKGEFGIPGRRYYQKGGSNRTHQIHAFLKDSPNIVRHLAFRDYLIEHSDIASEYAAVKRKGAAACNNSVADYCAYKNDFVQYQEALALEWWALNKRVKNDG